MTAAEKEYFNLTVWNMNGGPVPGDTIKALSEAVEAVLRDFDGKNGVRLLYAINSAKKGS